MNTEDKGLGNKSALERVGETGDIDVFVKLRELGAHFTSSVLHHAAKYGQVRKAEFDRYMLASRSCTQLITIFLQATFIQELIDRYHNEIDVNKRDYAGRPPIFVAAENCHLSTIQVMNFFLHALEISSTYMCTIKTSLGCRFWSVTTPGLTWLTYVIGIPSYL